MAVPDQASPPVRQPQLLHAGQEGFGFKFNGLRQQPPRTGAQHVGQRIVDIVRLTETDNIDRLVHGVSLSVRGSGRLDTRLDTPPSDHRRHPVSVIALGRPQAHDAVERLGLPGVEESTDNVGIAHDVSSTSVPCGLPAAASLSGIGGEQLKPAVHATDLHLPACGR